MTKAAKPATSATTNHNEMNFVNSKDWSRRRRVTAIGSSKNPLVFKESKFTNVTIDNPSLEVVFESSCELTNVNFMQNTGRIENARVTCVPFEEYHARIDGYGSESNTLCVRNQTFYKVAFDLNHVHILFSNCKFIDCLFMHDENISTMTCQTVSVKQYRAFFSSYPTDRFNNVYFEMRVGDTLVRGTFKMHDTSLIRRFHWSSSSASSALVPYPSYDPADFPIPPATPADSDSGETAPPPPTPQAHNP